MADISFTKQKELSKATNTSGWKRVLLLLMTKHKKGVIVKKRAVRQKQLKQYFKKNTVDSVINGRQISQPQQNVCFTVIPFDRSIPFLKIEKFRSITEIIWPH